MFRNILLVALGGAAGSVARYLLSKAVQGAAASSFPWGTGDALLSAAYIGSSVALGMLAVVAGAQLAKAFAG